MLKSIKILFEDDCYAVLDKPAGMLVIPTPKKETNTLTDILNREHCAGGEDARWHPCHRLDRDTSGVILFAKGKKNQQLMMDEFRASRVRKTYLAFVQGTPSKKEGEIRSVIKGFEEQKFSRHSAGKMAVTQYKVMRSFKDFSVVEVCPITGRTNQIRIHMSELGNPLVGERKYAFARDFELKFRRTALHARTIVWTHPVSKHSFTTSAPLPPDMEQFLKDHNL